MTALAAQLGDRVRLNCPVTDVAWGDGGVRIRLADAVTLSARRAIIAVPPALSGGIHYLPRCPPTVIS